MNCEHQRQLDNTTFARCLDCGQVYESRGGVWAWREPQTNEGVLIGTFTVTGGKLR